MVSDLAFANCPNEWEMTTLGQLVDTGGGSVQTGPFGSQLHASDYVEAGIPSVMPKNIAIEGIAEEEIARITPEDARRLAKYLLAEGDIIYSRRGDVEKSALVKPEEAGWLCGTGCLRVRLGKNPKVTPEFLHAYLSTPTIREWVSRNAIGATMPNLNTSILRDVPVLVPESKDIKYIASTWDAFNDKIQLNRQTNQTLESMAQALFKSWFVDFDPVIDNALAAGNDIPPELAARAEGRKSLQIRAEQHAALRASDTPDAVQHPQLPEAIRQLFPSSFVFHAEMGWIPKGWEVKPVGDVIQNVGGGTPKTSELSFWENGIHPFCTPKDMSLLTSKMLLGTERHLTDAGVEKISSGKLPVGTVLMSSRAPIGYLAITDTAVSVNQGIIAMKPSFPFGSEYILSWAEANMDEVISRANGSTFLEISKKNFREIPFVLPGDDVLQKYDALAKPYFTRITSIQKEVSQLTQLRDTLLPKLISGELRIPEAKQAVQKQTEQDVACAIE